MVEKLPQSTNGDDGQQGSNWVKLLKEREREGGRREGEREKERERGK